MSKKNFTDDEYIEAHRPNKAQLAEFIQQAKGDGRTMAEFAKACKSVSPSTFSRIVNGKITKPLPTELIETIIENAENPDSMSRDAFLRANGMVPKSEWENKSFSGSVREREMIFAAIKHTIADELYARGCMMMVYPRLPREELPKSTFYLYLPWRSRLVVSIQGQEPRFWNFIIHIPYAHHYIDLLRDDARSLLEGSVVDLLNRWSYVFLHDAWEPETLKDMKNSFVFIERQIFEAFCDLVMKIKVNTCMSVILADTAKQKVIEERMIPRRGKKTPSSIFDRKKIF